jgi:hypothetical protein
MRVKNSVDAIYLLQLCDRIVCRGHIYLSQVVYDQFLIFGTSSLWLE